MHKIRTNGDGKSEVATLDWRSRKKKNNNVQECSRSDSEFFGLSIRLF